MSGACTFLGVLTRATGAGFTGEYTLGFGISTATGVGTGGGFGTSFTISFFTGAGFTG
jgi:hypothetical protein